MSTLRRLVSLALMVVLTASIAAPVYTATAQSTPATVESVELAAQQAVATSTGADAASVIVVIVAEIDGWAYGTATVPASGEHGAPDVSFFLARNEGDGWYAVLRYTDQFNALLAETPADFPTPEIRATLDGFNPAGDGSADLSFPWAVGQSWRFNGPHPNGGGIWSSLDFYPNSIAANQPVLSMRGGVVYRPCANMVEIDHGDGWSTKYYHLINITVSQGQTVGRGAHIGGTSQEYNCGGFANGPHVHVWMEWQGSEVAIGGKTIGGWTVENGGQPYDGCLVRGSTRVCAEDYDLVPNDGTTGDGNNAEATISPTRSTVNNWVNYNLSDFPANATISITWRRLSGSSIAIGSVRANSSGNASGRFRVPATPGGPGQLITFAAGSVKATATFEVAPRIKVNTVPGVRGQTVDVSLRGYSRQESVRIRWRMPSGTWVEVARVTTSNTGSANVDVVVPSWAPDGNNAVRGDGTVFRQQTNVVYIQGGSFQAASEATPTASATATPVEIDRSALPTEPPLAIVDATDSAGNLAITSVFDDNPDTDWRIDPALGTAQLTVDLGQPATLSTVAWLRMTADCGTIDLIEQSQDGATWTPLPTPIEPGTPGAWQTLATSGDARYVRWTVTTAPEQTILGCLAEIEIWGAPVETATPTATETVTETATATETAVATETETPVETVTETPTEVPTELPTEAPTEVPTETTSPADASG